MNYSRRHFLKSAGVSITLPYMSSLASANSSWPTPPSTKRMVFVTTGLGMYPDAFFPKDYGVDFTAPPSLEPMMQHKGDFTVFSQMDHPQIHGGHGGPKSFLNGLPGSAFKSEKITSVDQVAAHSLGYRTRYPSLHIGVGGQAAASYSESGIKLRPEGSPQSLFKKLFVNDSEAAKKALAVEIEEQGSVLDLVKGQAKMLERTISRRDRDKLDEYLTAIREAEQRLQGLKRWQNVAKPSLKESPFADKEKDDDGYEFYIPILFDLFHLAFLSDSSRVITINYAIHNKVVPLPGVKTGYHGLSHHGKRPDRLAQLQIIERFYIEQLSRFVGKLKESQTVEGNMLDETMVFFGSALSDAVRHSNRNLPIMIAGGGFKHKGHYNAINSYKRQTPLNNLYTTMLQNFGIEIEKYNDATGDLSHILT